MLSNKNKKALEEKILDEIRQKVIKKSMQDQEHKDRMENEKANLEALEEISGLSKKEITGIARDVRQKYSKSNSDIISKKSILIMTFAVGAIILVGYIFFKNQGQTDLVVEPVESKITTVTTHTISDKQSAKTTQVKKITDKR